MIKKRDLWNALKEKDCPLCGGIMSYMGCNIDHIKPKSKGGGNNRDNLQLVHKKCNTIKGDNISCEELLFKVINQTEIEAVKSETPKKRLQRILAELEEDRRKKNIDW